MPLFLLVLLWTLSLDGLAILIGGGGHGLFWPVAVSGAPVPLPLAAPLGFFIFPVSLGFWYVTAWSAIRARAKLFFLLFGAHCTVTGAEAFFAVRSEIKPLYWTPGRVMNTFGGLLVGWLALFAAGQGFLWWSWAHARAAEANKRRLS